jgi:hypothetical protein
MKSEYAMPGVVVREMRRVIAERSGEPGTGSELRVERARAYVLRPVRYFEMRKKDAGALDRGWVPKKYPGHDSTGRTFQ